MSAPLHHPGATDAPEKRRTNGAPRPIDFPTTRPAAPELCRTRANTDNARWQAQVEQRDTLIQAAASVGRQEGERQGYVQGWHWGAACGAVGGGLAVGLLWLTWAPLQALIGAGIERWFA